MDTSEREVLMKLTEFLLVLSLALAFLIPTMKKDTLPIVRQAQEEKGIINSTLQTFRIVFQASNWDEEELVDIHWMKKAAETAKDAGSPYFKILQKKRKYKNDQGVKRTVIEGIIQLEEDAMNADYDAYEIENLTFRLNEKGE